MAAPPVIRTVSSGPRHRADGTLCYCVNEFELLSSLGEGAFGEVVLARAPDAELVALKCFSKTRLLKTRAVWREGGRTVGAGVVASISK
jgi:hypothetical protein